jgi:predicted transposase YbfD/YdcC
VSTQLNGYLDFPYVGQAFMIERQVIQKKSGKKSCEIAYCNTSQAECDATAIDILRTNRNHWCIENSCHYILDWSYDEDRCRILTQHGPENISRIRRFAIGVIRVISARGVTETMNVRLVFDYLKMTKNSLGSH